MIRVTVKGRTVWAYECGDNIVELAKSIPKLNMQRGAKYPIKKKGRFLPPKVITNML